MKLKTNLKFLLVLGVIFLSLLLFNTNAVNAVEVTEEYLQQMLDVLPNEITIDIPEIEYQKGEGLIKEKIKEIWRNNNISTEEININVYGGSIYLGIEGFYNAEITVDNSYNNKSKTISIVYNNTNKKNPNDEQMIKGLNIVSPKYFTYEFDFKNQKDVLQLSEKYYNNLINDNSIVIKADSGAGDGTLLNSYTCEGGTSLGIFKNGILYDIKYKIGWEWSVPVITIPNTITEDKLNDYLMDLLIPYCEKYIAENTYGYDYDMKKATITKGTSGMHVDIPNGYTLSNYGDEYDKSYFIIKREGGTSNTPSIPNTPNVPNVPTTPSTPNNPVNNTITTTDNKTNIKLDSTDSIIPKNTTMEVTPITEGNTYNNVKEVLSNVKQFKLYDITLKSNGTTIQPNGKVKISIPIPNEFDKTKTVVYRVTEDKKQIEYTTKIEGNYAVIETDHFSNYVLAEKEIKSNNIISNTNTVNKGEKDDTPKTSTVDIIGYVSIITIISMVGIITLKKKLK